MQKRPLATAKYIGPDRRNGWTPRDGPKTAVFKVPNSLKAKVTGDNLTVSQLEIEIQASIAKIKNYKLSERIEV
jgi:hypothetical protein